MKFSLVEPRACCNGGCLKGKAGKEAHEKYEVTQEEIDNMVKEVNVIPSTKEVKADGGAAEQKLTEPAVAAAVLEENDIV